MEKNLVCFIRHLKNLGYTQKEIMIITKVNKSAIYRIWHGQSYPLYAAKDYQYDPLLEKQKGIFDLIKGGVEIPGVGFLKDEDKQYVKLLKYCNLSYKDIRNIYSDRPAREIRALWLYDDTTVKIRDFDSTLIGISREDFLEFLGEKKWT